MCELFSLYVVDLSDGVAAPFEDGSFVFSLQWIMVSIEHMFVNVKMFFEHTFDIL